MTKYNSHLTAEQAQQLREHAPAVFPPPSETNEEEEERQWNEMYDKLQAYKEEHGDCQVPTSDYSDPLVKWVLAQRRYYK